MVLYGTRCQRRCGDDAGFCSPQLDVANGGHLGWERVVPLFVTAVAAGSQ
jgi:hypothetical protein